MNEKEEIISLCDHFFELIRERVEDDIVSIKVIIDENIIYLKTLEETNLECKLVCIDNEEAQYIFEMVNEVIEEVKFSSYDA